MSKKKYMVHVWGYGPIKVSPWRAKALLKRDGGTYHWLDDYCHVYLKPVFEVKVECKVPKIAETT